jgi:hypothetical protein
MCIDLEHREIRIPAKMRPNGSKGNRVLASQRQNPFSLLEETVNRTVEQLQSTVIGAFAESNGGESHDSFFKAEFTVQLLVIELDKVGGAQNRCRASGGPSTVADGVLVRGGQDGNGGRVEPAVARLQTKKIGPSREGAKGWGGGHD